MSSRFVAVSLEAHPIVALEALDVVKRKGVNELWGVGENVDNACEACQHCLRFA